MSGYFCGWTIGVRFHSCEGIIFVTTGFGVHPAANEMDNECFYLRLKCLRPEVGHCLHQVLKLRTPGTVPPLIMSSLHGAWLSTGTSLPLSVCIHLCLSVARRNLLVAISSHFPRCTLGWSYSNNRACHKFAHCKQVAQCRTKQCEKIVSSGFTLPVSASGCYDIVNCCI
jgi:hypothetical protein